MKPYPNRSRTIGLAAGIGAAVVLALAPCSRIAAQGFSLSQTPLVLPSALNPNVILTLDDSPNMARAISPDSNYSAAIGATRRFKSSKFNPLYYDPNVTYGVPIGASNTATSFTNALIDGYYNGGGGWTVDLSSKYRPTLSYDASGTNQTYADHYAADLTAINASSANTGGKAYYYNYNGACGDPNNDNCYSIVIVGAAEQQNFANWYSYYRTRHLSMVTAAWRVMSDSALSGTRVAWQALNSCNSFSTSGQPLCPTNTASSSNNPPNVSNLIDTFTDARRSDLQGWLRAVRPTGSSAPLRSAMSRAGQYYSTPSTTSPNNPYLTLPQQSASSTNLQYSCRPNFHILVAGSPWDDADNNFCGSGNCGNVDGNNMTWADQTLYSNGSPRNVSAGTPPWSDANSNSLADIAMYYWLHDLRPDLNNNLLPYFGDRRGTGDQQELNPANDPAVWQHMVNFVVGVGLKGSVDTTNLPPLGSPSYWPTTGAGLPGNLYDLWHAAVNSRGGYFGADTPGQLVDALTNSLSRAAPVSGGSNLVGTSLATNSTRLSTDSALYQAQFYVNDWTGRLRRLPIDASGAVQLSVTDPGYWDAADRMPTASSRNIATSTSPVGGGVNFDWSTSALQGYLGSQAIANYLRGDQSNEGTGAGQYRVRSRVLGDIVDSDIIFAGGENFGYQDLNPDNYDLTNTYTNSYNLFVAAKQSRTEMIYVGANDGMLHGFRAEAGSTGGVEVFAYVPRTLLLDPVSATDSRSALVQLSDPSYNGNHRFFVDGSPWIGDACLKSSGGPASNCTFTSMSSTDWRTVLVGTTGAGGRGVFALDVTNPESFGPSNVLWDLAGQEDNDLGYTIGQPVVGRLHDGYYYAIFGNGYLSPNGCSVLYLVRLQDGQIRRISTTQGNLGSNNSSTACTTASGLGRPSLFDADGDRITDAIYVAGMQGNVWKFDVSSSDPTQWKVAVKSGSTPAPLFTARNKCGGVQPITGLLELGAPPNGQNGVMIYFGTGRFLSATDRTDTTRQSFYGLLDRGVTSPLNSPGAATTGDTTCATAPASDLSARSTLQEQTLSAFSNGTRTITSNATIDYTASGGNLKNGWFVDLSVSDPVSGQTAAERVVSAPTLLAGRVIFPTLIPSADVCAGGGSSAVVALDPFNGGTITTSSGTRGIFVSSGQAGYDSFLLNVGIVKNLIAVDSGTNVFLFAGGSSGNVQTIKTIAQQQTGGSIRGRTAWREVFQ